jgi:hypothetical protein
MNHLAKLEKECKIIQQEIENERLVFRNKIKIVENYLGDSINIDKLINEEEEELSHSHSGFATGPIKSRASVRAQPAQAFGNKFNLGTSEFKRLKDISDAIRNTHNILNEQSKKIESLQLKRKELFKVKDSLIYNHAHEVNQLKAKILSTREEIKRKSMEIEEKTSNGTFTKKAEIKSKNPNEEAVRCLEKYKEFVNSLQPTNLKESLHGTVRGTVKGQNSTSSK